MNDPLASIPPLIPTPSSSRSSSNPTKRDALEDRFATLFQPPTPRASPNRGNTPIFAATSTSSVEPTEPSHVASPPPKRPGGHRSRAPSAADSDFGDFVSVPAAEAPLMPAPSPPRANGNTHVAGAQGGSDAWATRQSLDFFESLGKAAQEASERNRSSVLDELIEHDNDPLSFLSSGHEQGRSAATTPKPPSPLPPLVASPNAIDEPSLLDRTLAAFTQPAVPQSASPPMSSATPPLTSDTPLTQHKRPGKHPTPNSSSGSLSFSARWMPSLLTRTSTSTSAAPRESISGFFSSSPPLSSALPPYPGEPSSKPSSPPHSPPILASAPSSLAGTISRAAASTLSAVVAGVPPAPTPGGSLKENPFAAHVFIPPSGAPGFSGDRTWNKGFEFDAAGVEANGPALVGRKESTVGVLTPAITLALRAHLPALARLPKTWNLLYSLDQHGISLRTLYTRSEKHLLPSILAVQNAAGTVFGACVGEGIRMQPGAYYGGGESFLWRAEADGSVNVWKWTGRNDYVALCEVDSISFGGGDGHYGLFLDDTLFDGSSAACPTFDNEPLCAPGTPLRGGEARFECVGVEVWGVGP